MATLPMGTKTKKLETIQINLMLFLKKSQLAGGRPVDYDGAAKEGNSEQSRTNSMSDRVEGLNPGPPDYKPSATITLPHYVFCSLLFG